ncbi:MAG: hypothetical protein OXE78_15390 [Gammaproteobacteria bacterium]|nr:hypothetical protein [Gammaproteobacteria bacterium]MCY4358473.1 hypothetical protein [Gammaproteobacteria bacterium]
MAELSQKAPKTQYMDRLDAGPTSFLIGPDHRPYLSSELDEADTIKHFASFFLKNMSYRRLSLV